jgi:hypothetical protein
VDVNANFFQMGGSSLRAGLINSKIRRTTEMDISGMLIYQHPTIRSMAAAVECTFGCYPPDSCDDSCSDDEIGVGAASSSSGPASDSGDATPAESESFGDCGNSSSSKPGSFIGRYGLHSRILRIAGRWLQTVEHWLRSAEGGVLAILS